MLSTFTSVRWSTVSSWLGTLLFAGTISLAPTFGVTPQITPPKTILGFDLGDVFFQESSVYDHRRDSALKAEKVIWFEGKQPLYSGWTIAKSTSPVAKGRPK